MASSSSWSGYTVASNTIAFRSLSHRHLSSSSNFNLYSHQKKKRTNAIVNAKLAQKTELQYRKLGDSDLNISEIAIGTMTFGEQNTEKEAHEILSYSFDQGINILDTSEAVSSLQPQHLGTVFTLSMKLMIYANSLNDG